MSTYRGISLDVSREPQRLSAQLLSSKRTYYKITSHYFVINDLPVVNASMICTNYRTSRQAHIART